MAVAPRVLLLTDPAMAGHRPPGHEERPERLGAAIDGVLGGALAGFAEVQRPAVEAAGGEVLERVHPADHLMELEDAGRRGTWIDLDTYVGPGSMDAARLAAGATVQAALAAAQGRADVAFAVVRPPGHHAHARRAAGFCLMNNVAVAVMALRAAGVGRIGLLDWDVHHGDGTQDLFDHDPQLLYVSTHQWPLYPGSGHPDERGQGAAEGTMHNHPLPPGAGDEAFVAAWTESLLPAVEAFAPQALLVSAGYDAHRDDPLANLLVTDAGFGAVAEAVGAMASRLDVTGVALSLEGGYDLEAVRRSVAATVTGLLHGLRAPGEAGPA
jgi:acetoin utilization deacetylase AcuC-like enzyme